MVSLPLQIILVNLFGKEIKTIFLFLILLTLMQKEMDWIYHLILQRAKLVQTHNASLALYALLTSVPKILTRLSGQLVFQTTILGSKLMLLRRPMLLHTKGVFLVNRAFISWVYLGNHAVDHLLFGGCGTMLNLLLTTSRNNRAILPTRAVQSAYQSSGAKNDTYSNS